MGCSARYTPFFALRSIKRAGKVWTFSLNRTGGLREDAVGVRSDHSDHTYDYHQNDNQHYRVISNILGGFVVEARQGGASCPAPHLRSPYVGQFRVALTKG